MSVLSDTGLSGNRVELLENGSAYFPALCAAIDVAQYEIDLQTYIFNFDATGVMIAAALIRVAQRGVQVRVLVDGFGSRNASPERVAELRQAGVNWVVFHPEHGLISLRRHRLRRLHRKVVVIDAQIAFVGGINIIDDMETPGQIPPRCDYAVRVRGPILRTIAADVSRLWAFVCFIQNRIASHVHPHPEEQSSPVGSDRVRFLVRDDFHHRRDIEQAYLAAIKTAHESILIANAYFLPGIRFRRMLTDAAARGVKVTLLLQGRLEYRLMRYASHAFYGQLLGAGVNICEYRKSFLHAKVAVIDGCWATVGSSNIDPFSLLLAREANLVIESSEFAQTLTQRLLIIMQQGGVAVRSADWQRRAWYQKLLSSMALALVRVLTGLVGYSERK